LTTEIDNKWVQILNSFDIDTISYVVQKLKITIQPIMKKTNNQVTLVTPNELGGHKISTHLRRI
jgi:hypothetical protein